MQGVCKYDWNTLCRYQLERLRAQALVLLIAEMQRRMGILLIFFRACHWTVFFFLLFGVTIILKFTAPPSITH